VGLVFTVKPNYLLAMSYDSGLDGGGSSRIDEDPACGHSFSLKKAEDFPSPLISPDQS